MKINMQPPYWVGYDPIRDTWFKGTEDAINDCTHRDIQLWLKEQAKLLHFKEEPVFLGSHSYKEIYNYLLSIGMCYTTGQGTLFVGDVLEQDSQLLKMRYEESLLVWYHFSNDASDMYILFPEENIVDVAWLEAEGAHILDAWGWRSSHIEWFKWLGAYTDLIAKGDITILETVLNTPLPAWLLEHAMTTIPDETMAIETIIQLYYQSPTLQEEILWMS